MTLLFKIWSISTKGREEKKPVKSRLRKNMLKIYSGKASEVNAAIDMPEKGLMMKNGSRKEGSVWMTIGRV